MRKRFNFIFLAWSLTIVSIRPLLVNRMSLYHELPGTLMSNEFLIAELFRIDLLNCAKKCLAEKGCKSFAHGRWKCLLYSSDPRIEFFESSLIRTDNPSPLKLMVICTKVDIPCYINNVKAYSESHFATCAIEEKITDAKCSEWSNWDYVYDSPCGNWANIQTFRQESNELVLFGSQKT